MRCATSITLLAATLGSGCLVVSSGIDGGSVSSGASSSGNTSSGGTSAGSTSGTATGGGPAGVALTVSPNPINFGFVPITTTVIGCTTVTNPGSVAVEILGANDFIDAGAFALSQVDDATPPNPAPVPTTLASGASTEVCFSLTPPVTQQYDGQATLETSEGLGPVVQLTGWGGGPQWSCLPQRIDFGDILVGSTVIFPILCTNTGTAVPGPEFLTVEIVPSVPGLSAWFDPPEPDGGFGSGMTIRIAIRYTPPIPCSGFNTSLVLKPIFEQELEIPMTDQGGCPFCELAISPPKLDFGNVPVGETSPVLTTSFQNVGSSPCELEGFRIDGGPTDSFQIVSTSIQPDPQAGLILLQVSDAGAASSILVQTSFAPQAAGVFGGQLAISIPEQPSPDVPLTGTSESTCLAVTPTSLDFGADGIDAGQLQFSVSNQCPAPALLQSITLQSGPGDSVPQYSVPFGPTLPAVISPGSPLTYLLSCAPSSAGEHPAQLILSDGYVDTLLWLTCSSP